MSDNSKQPRRPKQARGSGVSEKKSILPRPARLNKGRTALDKTEHTIQSKSRHERVSVDEDGQRIDNFLLRRCSGVPRSHIYRLIRKGEVRVDGKKIKQTRKLCTGEQVRIPALEVKASGQAVVPDNLAQVIGGAVLFEHEDFLVLNKPPGIAVHGGSGLAFGLIDGLRQHRHEPKLELAHRLDRATSGCLLVGRSLKATRELQNLFRGRTITKRYVALVDGVWPEELVTIDAPLLKNVESAGQRRVVVHSSGQSAITHFSVRHRYERATLVDVDLETGRTHQIRVHARHAGHAVVGDLRYGDNKRNKEFKNLGLNRLFLHSLSLEFQWAGESYKIEAETGDAWKRALSFL
ncbi:MAG: RluA family pseudouridine synthase [Granulosicoccus sp.]